MRIDNLKLTGEVDDDDADDTMEIQGSIKVGKLGETLTLAQVNQSFTQNQEQIFTGQDSTMVVYLNEGDKLVVQLTNFVDVDVLSDPDTFEDATKTLTFPITSTSGVLTSSGSPGDNANNLELTYVITVDI